MQRGHGYRRRGAFFLRQNIQRAQHRWDASLSRNSAGATAAFNEEIGQRGFAVIDVRDDRKIADVPNEAL